MFEVLFHLDVVKVDWDVTHIAMAIHVCCMGMFQMFQLFQKHVVSVRFNCFNYFRCMLQVFYLNIAYVVVTTHYNIYYIIELY
jgi:hypothetical protein